MITEMPTEDEFKRGHKYPFVVSEILSMDIQEIQAVFFKSIEEEDQELAKEKQRQEELESQDTAIGGADSDDE